MFTNFTWTHDERLLYDKDNLLNWLNPETGAKGILSTGQNPGNGDPWECSDGQYIVFLHGLQGGGDASLNVWRANSSGGNLKQLTQDKSDNFPVCAPDSKSVFYMEGGSGHVMQVPIDGGAPKANYRTELGRFFRCFAGWPHSGVRYRRSYGRA